MSSLISVLIILREVTIFSPCKSLFEIRDIWATCGLLRNMREKKLRWKGLTWKAYSHMANNLVLWFCQYIAADWIHLPANSPHFNLLKWQITRWRKCLAINRLNQRKRKRQPFHPEQFGYPNMANRLLAGPFRMNKICHLINAHGQREPAWSISEYQVATSHKIK